MYFTHLIKMSGTHCCKPKCIFSWIQFALKKSTGLTESMTFNQDNYFKVNHYRLEEGHWNEGLYTHLHKVLSFTFYLIVMILMGFSPFYSTLTLWLFWLWLKKCVCNPSLHFENSLLYSNLHFSPFSNYSCISQFPTAYAILLKQ